MLEIHMKINLYYLCANNLYMLSKYWISALSGILSIVL